MKYRLLFRFILIMVVMAVIYARPTSHAPRLVPTGLDCMSDAKILFSSNRDGDYEIYLMDSDGSHVTQLTYNTGIADILPRWNRVRQQMLYLSEAIRINQPQIYSMNLDGTDSTRLTSYPNYHGGASWSPDGQELVFDYFEAGGHDIYKLKGEDYIRLTDSRAYTGPDILLPYKGSPWWTPVNTNPVWSPDSQQIAFSSSRDGNYEIYLMNADGSDQTRLTYHPATDYVGSWSPDGQKIAFVSNRKDRFDIYVMNKDGTAVTHLVPLTEMGSVVEWSPDGQKLLFNSDNDGDREIYVINMDGTNLTQLTHNVAITGEIMTRSKADDFEGSWVTFRSCYEVVP